MRWGTLWMLLPDEALPLIIVGLGIALILGLLTGRTVLGILGLVVLLPVLGPFVEGMMGTMPPWISLVILAIIGISLLRGVAALFIGQQAADTMTGHLAADVVRMAVACLFFPFRLVGWFLRNGRL